MLYCSKGWKIEDCIVKVSSQRNKALAANFSFLNISLAETTFSSWVAQAAIRAVLIIPTFLLPGIGFRELNLHS